MMTEIWKDIPGFEDSYQVSNYGNLRGKDRYRKVCGGSYRLVKGKQIAPVKCTNGYYEAQLSRNQKKTILMLHRAVAMAFIPNPDNLPEINHKDEDITNNRVDNLEWCTSKYNANYGTRNARCLANNKQKVRVNQLSLDGEFIKTWDSIGEVRRTLGIDVSQIIRVCTGRNITAGGYKWEYTDR